MSLSENYSEIAGVQDELNQLKSSLIKHEFEVVDTHFKDLETAVRASKLKLIEEFGLEISDVLEGEIIKRYFYREGMYAYFLATNDEVFKAQEMIINREVYNNILK